MKRPLPFTAFLCLILCLAFGSFSFAQSGKVSGTIEDNEGQPMPGVNIMIKGTTTGVQTNFDGQYSIRCNVGDVLVITYIGQQTREVKVTASMFGEKQVSTAVKNEAVETILDTVYQNKVRKNLPSFLVIPNIEESSKTHNGSSYINTARLKDIKINGNKVKLSYFERDIYYEVGASSTLGLAYIKQSNLPQIQTTYAQGTPFNGVSTHFGPETGVFFSYGPNLNSLRFDGNTYPFDVNGRLVPAAQGVGQIARAYDNNPFKTITKTSNNLFFNISTSKYFFGFDYVNKSGKDLYGSERNNHNEFDLSIDNSSSYSDVNWGLQLKHLHTNDNQPNLNGFRNNLLFNALVTPPSFSNAQDEQLQDLSQRSFAPSSANNPLWLLNKNRNTIQNALWLGKLYGTFDITHNVDVIAKVSLTSDEQNQQFGVLPNTIGFLDGYRSDKILSSTVLDSKLTVDYEPYIGYGQLKVLAFGNYTNENFDYKLSEQDALPTNSFVPVQNTFSLQNELQRQTFRLQTKLDYTFLDYKARVVLVNNAFSSSIQNSKWYLPTIQFEYQLARHWNSNFLRTLNISGSFGKDVNPTELFYRNQSHNSLRITPQESLSFTANQDLFASNSVALEEKESYELNLEIGFQLFDGRWSLESTYYSNTTEGSVFPVWEANRYDLQNIADVKDWGIEWVLSGGTYQYEGLKFSPRLLFSSYRTKVRDLHRTVDRIPIAGFSSISKNLIIGEPAGVLYGTAYDRDLQGNMIIDTEGYPLVDQNQTIIGDPTPDFNMGLSGTLKYKRVQFDFVLDCQKGGDVYNGTQSVLNYFGTSAQSAVERNIENFVFAGVTTQGNPNTTPVDFGNPANGLEGNRFVRYGFEGVGEEAVVDGSYLNLRSIDLSYEFNSDAEDPFFRQFKIGIYGTNLFTASKFEGASPYSSLFDHSSSQGLNFFNTPLISEVGMKINIKI